MVSGCPGFQNFRKKIELPPVGIELGTLTINGLEVSCLTKSAMVCQSQTVKLKAMLYWISEIIQLQKRYVVHQTKISNSAHVWLAQLDRHHDSKPVSVVFLQIFLEILHLKVSWQNRESQIFSTGLILMFL